MRKSLIGGGGCGWGGVEEGVGEGVGVGGGGPHHNMPCLALQGPQ